MAEDFSQAGLMTVQETGPVQWQGQTAEIPDWMPPEHMDAITRMFEEAEKEAMISWEDDVDELDYALELQDSSSLGFPSLMAQAPRPSPQKRSQPEWNDKFIGIDKNKPPPLRRYFDHLPRETSLPKQPMRADVRKMHGPQHSMPDIWSVQHPAYVPHISEATARRLQRTGSGCLEVKNEEREKRWVGGFAVTCSSDNDKLNPMLRHYFDRRGLESSYRERPDVDKVTPKLRPRTPQRPSTPERLLRFYASDPALGSGNIAKKKVEEETCDTGKRGEGDIFWGRRCLLYGANNTTTRGADGAKIPWVFDHHKMEAEDNEILNPLLRHYFEREGLESSFRMRGRAFGRPLRGVNGMSIPTDPADRRKAAAAAAREREIVEGSCGSPASGSLQGLRRKQ